MSDVKKVYDQRRAFQTLILAIGAENKPYIMAMSQFMLKQISSEAALNDMVIALDDPEAEIRRVAIFLLGVVAKPETVKDLSVTLSREDDPENKELIVWALKEIKSEEAISCLVQLLKNREQLADNANVALLHTGGLITISQLINVLNDSDRSFRQKVIAILETLTKESHGQKIREWKSWWREYSKQMQ